MRTTALLLALATAACAGGTGPGTPAPGAPAFTYAVPQPATLTYERTDSSLMSMEIPGMGAMNIDVGMRTLADLAHSADAAGGVRVGITFTSFDATLSNPMSGNMRFSDLPGAGVVTVEADGDVTVAEKPAMSAELMQLAGGESLVRNYFLQLPTRDVAVGATWVDTLTVTEDAGGMTTTSETVVRSTWVRDTTVAGRVLRVVESTMDATAQVDGSSEGMRIQQSLAGNGTATTLWDPARRILVDRHERMEMSGSMSIPDAGMSGVPVSMVTRSRVRLQGQD